MVCILGVCLHALVYSKSISDYARGLAGDVGRKLLRDCLMQIHKDVITCWNFEGEVTY